MAYGITDFSHVKIDYTDDTGVLHTISQRTAVQAAVGNVVATGANPGRPAGWKLRHIQAYTVVSGKTLRKRIVIGDPTNDLFDTAAGGTFSCDGVTWTVAGRIGEKRVNR